MLKMSQTVVKGDLVGGKQGIGAVGVFGKEVVPAGRRCVASVRVQDKDILPAVAPENHHVTALSGVGAHLPVEGPAEAQRTV